LTLTDIAIVLLIGFALGYTVRSLIDPGRGPRLYDVHVTPTSTMHLHYIGQLDERNFRRLCWWVTDGRPFRLVQLMQAGILTRSEYQLVREELINRRMAIRNRDRTTTITPPGMAFFRWGGGRDRQTSDKHTNNPPGWTARRR